MNEKKVILDFLNYHMMEGGIVSDCLFDNLDKWSDLPDVSESELELHWSDRLAFWEQNHTGEA